MPFYTDNKISLLQHAMDHTKKTYAFESEEFGRMSALTFCVDEEDVDNSEEADKRRKPCKMSQFEKTCQQLNRLQRKGHRNRRQSSMEMHRHRRRRSSHRRSSLRIKARQAQGQRRSSMRRGRDPPGRFEETVQELNRMQLKW